MARGQDWFPAEFIPFERDACEQSIPERFCGQVERRADALAVKIGDRAASYRELDRMAGRIASAVLAAAGEGPGPVVLLFGTSLLHVAADLGVLMAGRPVVTVDPAFPSARIAGILQDSGAPLVLTDDANAALARRLALPGQTVLDVESTPLPADTAFRPSAPGDPAFILYTAGSTGEPKGVVQSHRNLLAVARAYCNELGVCPSDRLTCPTSLSYTGSIWVMLAALMNGAAFVSCRYETPHQLAAMMAREATTVVHLIASLMRHLVFAADEPLELPALRLLYCGGEAIHPADVERFRRVFPARCRLVHLLGSTEAGVVTNYTVRPEDAARPAGPLPCGRPVDDVRVRIQDDSGRELPAGEPGEIVVRGRYVLDGYWRRPDLTAQRVTPLPGGERLFRTGDMGRLLPDGRLMHAGRRDFEVKVRGHRMNLGEPEHALLGLDGVGAAVVQARADAEGDTVLTAYVVLEPGAQATVSDLRCRLGALVPEFMVPGRFVFLDELPVSGTGKVDRSALPEPGRLRPPLDVPYVEPASPIERLLAGIWSELLQVEPVGLRDSFFDLGGTSLTAARLSARLQSALDVEFDQRSFFESPTVVGLAGMLVAELGARLTGEELDSILRTRAKLRE